jgi:hypothetical protein
MTINQKLEKIKLHPDFKSRAIKTLVSAFESGINLKETGRLVRLVEEAYKIGEHRQPAHVKREFEKALNFLKKELKGLKR